MSLQEGETLLHRLLASGVDLAHDCGGVLACSSCRVVIRRGLEQIDAASEEELDMLDRAGAAAPGARLACQVIGMGELNLDIPRGEAPEHAALRPVSLTRRAAQHLSSQLAKHSGAMAVRLSVAHAGCSGLRYRVDPAGTIGHADSVFEIAGVRVVVDAASLPYLQGTTIDLAEEELAKRLRFDNPNVLQSCGCGESFSV